MSDNHRADIIKDLKLELDKLTEPKKRDYPTEDAYNKALEDYRENTPYPIIIKHVLDGFPNPVALADNQLPAIYYAYGDSNPTTSISTSVRHRAEKMTVILYAVINKGNGKDLLERCADMHNAIELLIAGNQHIGGNRTREVRLGPVRTFGGRLTGGFRGPDAMSDREFMEIHIEIYHVYDIYRMDVQ